jgi:alkaline phosphatase D
MSFSRRKFVKGMGILIPAVTSQFNKLLANNLFENGNHTAFFKREFKKSSDRIWIGKDFWSVPLEDWEVENGRLQFTGLQKNSRLHLLTYVLKHGNGTATLKADLGLAINKGNNGSVGFTIGIKDFTDPESIKAACYFGQGISAGVSLDGVLFIADQKVPLPEGFNFEQFSLQLNCVAVDDKNELEIIATDKQKTSEKVSIIYSGNIAGLVALENNVLQKNESTFWCSSIVFSGTKLAHQPNNSFGPILWAMYTLSDLKVKLTVQLPPISKMDAQKIELHLLHMGKWQREKTAQVDPVSFTGNFILDNWDEGKEVAYRIVYNIDGSAHAYDGSIRQNPLDKPLKFGALTCQNGSGFPYRPLVENLEKSDPDILFFSGDQLYEQNGGYPIKRAPEAKAILSYLGKWYMFGWAFGNVMRNRPTICTPDDHDVFQGNLWGEGGAGISIEEFEKTEESHGGFAQTPLFVNTVNKTQCGHLPDPFHKSPLASGIATWFANLNYGGVSFAIISDRLFKSGPEMIRKGTGRIDHIMERASPGSLASDELEFLGKQQMQFLDEWITDWQKVSMKVLLSQTLFSNAGTHHGPDKDFFYGDMDSGGWPKKQRDEVIKLIRKAAAFHINGDQHVPFLVQYGVDEPRDGGWTFCSPAIASGYPRWGQPDLVNMPFTDRPKHNLPNTGVYRDFFGNDNYIYAVGNPVDNFQNENRYMTAQNKASGFGLITFDTKERTIRMEAFRFLANLDNLSAEDTFPGWPLTINQMDNYGRRPIGYLPKLKTSHPDQMLKIINEETHELIAAIRIKGNDFTPSVYENAKYTLIIGEGQYEKTLKGISISDNPDEQIDT